MLYYLTFFWKLWIHLSCSSLSRLLSCRRFHCVARTILCPFINSLPVFILYISHLGWILFGELPFISASMTFSSEHVLAFTLSRCVRWSHCWDPDLFFLFSFFFRRYEWCAHKCHDSHSCLIYLCDANEQGNLHHEMINFNKFLYEYDTMCIFFFDQRVRSY